MSIPYGYWWIKSRKLVYTLGPFPSDTARPPEEREKLAPNWMNEDEPFLGVFRNRSDPPKKVHLTFGDVCMMYFPTCTPLKLYSNNVGYLFFVDDKKKNRFRHRIHHQFAPPFREYVLLFAQPHVEKKGNGN